MRPVTVIAIQTSLILTLASCDGTSTLETEKDKTISAAVIAKSVLSSGEPVTLSGSEGEEIAITVTGTQDELSHSGNAPIIPDAILLSYIRGITTDTVNISLESEIKDAYLRYENFLSGMGYENKNLTMTDSLFTGAWTANDGTGTLRINAYQNGTQVIMSLTFPNMR